MEPSKCTHVRFLGDVYPRPRGLCPSRSPCLTGSSPHTSRRSCQFSGFVWLEPLRERPSPWGTYLAGLLEAAGQVANVGIFPIRLPGCVDGGLTALLGGLQALHSSSTYDRGVLCRELSQQVAQMIGDPLGDRLTVFISHTKRHSPDEEPDHVDALVARVRSRIAETHLYAYIDDVALQPGSNWADELRSRAASSSLLAVRD